MSLTTEMDWNKSRITRLLATKWFTWVGIYEEDRTYSRMTIKLGIQMYVRGYVEQIRLRLRIFICVCIHVCECVHAYLCNKHTENGSQYVTWLKFLESLSSVCVARRHPMRLQKSDSRSHPQTHTYQCIWISALYIFAFWFLSDV